VLQLSKVRDASTTEETYMEVIRGKTAMLFEASTHSAAALCGATAEQAKPCAPLVTTWVWRSSW
jgi:octaprenyl-diphosphate synthase